MTSCGGLLVLPGGVRLQADLCELLRKGFLAPSRRRSPAIDAEELLVHPSADRARGHAVRQRRELAADFRDRAHVAEDAFAERNAVFAPVLREEFTFEARDVNADRTFRLARAALETEVQRLEHAFVAK